MFRRTRLTPAFLLADIKLPDGSGEQLYRAIIPYLARTTVVFATAYGDISQAVRLISAGANDYITKPYDADALVARIRHAVAAFGESRALSGPLSNPFPAEGTTTRVAHEVERLVEVDFPVLLEGETGVGKELTARYIHARSSRRDQPFTAINCAELSDSLAEVQWFGHTRGAFSGAGAASAGLFAQAAGGTLYLDEVSEMPPRAQALLLRALDSNTFRPLGAAENTAFHCRVLTSTNADLRQQVAQKKFREDLYYRLAVVEVKLPALRERHDQILRLAREFLAQSSEPGRTQPRVFSSECERALLDYSWPGNVRELKNRVTRAAVMNDGQTLEAADMFPDSHAEPSPPQNLVDVRAEAEWRSIQIAVANSDGNLTHAAKALGVSRTTLWKKMKQFKDGERGV